MRPDLAIFASLLFSTVAAGTIDTTRTHNVARVDGQSDHQEDGGQHADLWKRRGGGGGGGRGGGGFGGGGKGGGGSRGGGGGSRGGSHSSGKGTNTKHDSNVGGYSKGGTGPQPSYAGGHYAGGAKVPYAAGDRSPSGIQPYPLYGNNLAFWPGVWPGAAFMYGPYNYHHHYHNKTSHKDEDREIICGCAKYSVCMCDEIDDKRFWDDLVGDGDYDKLNKSVVDVSKVNGTTTLLVNGTLPNGTTVNSDNPKDYEKYLTNAAAAVGSALGLWPAIATVMGAVFLL